MNQVEKDYAAQLQEKSNEADALEFMIGTEGWKLLEKRLKLQLARAEEGMLKADTGDLAMKASASFVAIKSVLDWPREVISLTRQAIRQQVLEKQTK